MHAVSADPGQLDLVRPFDAGPRALLRRDGTTKGLADPVPRSAAKTTIVKNLWLFAGRPRIAISAREGRTQPICWP
jgi:hypothetical protein